MMFRNGQTTTSRFISSIFPLRFAIFCSNADGYPQKNASIDEKTVMSNQALISAPFLRILLFGLLVTMIACGEPSGSETSTSADAANLEGFTTERLANGITKAVKSNAEGGIAEQGTLLNGVKNGTWTTYHPNGRVQSITSFVNGKKDGLHMELTNRGQVELSCHYKNDEYDGLYATYKFGTRPIKAIEYKNGELDGFYREYHDSNGKLQKEISYKNGVQDGPFRQYNADEQLIMEYEYKDGKKVSGGIVTPEAKEE